MSELRDEGACALCGRTPCGCPNLNLAGVKDLYLTNPLIARFMDRTGFVAFIDPPGDDETDRRLTT